jgi:broad specificity phosphatase PhoE
MDLSNNEEAFGVKRQKIVFVRHGVAKHNLLDDKGNPPNLNDPELFDPPLVLEGKKQVVDAGERLRIWWHTTQGGEHVELVISSPLTRCLQTAALAFLPGDSYVREMPEPTFACMDLVREAHGMSYPDRRRKKDLLVVSNSILAYSLSTNLLKADLLTVLHA